MKTVIQSERIIGPDGMMRGSVVTEGGRIASLSGDRRLSPPDAVVIDAGTRYVSPGFIDIHTHGAGGFDFMDGTVEAILGAARAHMQHGATAIVPTSLACSDEELFSLYHSFSQARTVPGGPALLGLHLEGPYFSQAQRGAQDPAHLKVPLPAHVSRLLDASQHVIRVTAAPELPYGLELGDELRRRGILASIGHSDATYAQVRQAMAHGYTHVTHLYSGMSSLHREGPYRVLGVVESAYLEDRLDVEIIADGVHLPPELLRLILRCKDHSRICLVTDSMRGAGMPEGSRVMLGSLRGGQEVVLRDGVAMLPDMTAFAGSVCTADRCVRTIARLGVLDMWESVMLMTRNPARIIGAGRRKGQLLPGMDADICIFDDDVSVQAVMVGGEFTVDRLSR